MALVAFDLDNTLGSFDAVGPWAYFFNVETLETSNNRPVLSPTLKARLKKAEDFLIEKIGDEKDIVELIFRSNLDALIAPIVKAKRSGKVKAVCIYSNTGCTFSMQFAKKLIEERYSCPGFFDCVVGATHPIRKYDWEQNKKDKIQPLKTFVGLKKIFKELCGVSGRIYPSNILFVDDRVEKHHLVQEEKDGLTYLQVSAYVPNISKNLRKRIYFIGLQVLLEMKLIDCAEYLSSNIFHSEKHPIIGGEPTNVEVDGFFSLLGLVENSILIPYFPPMTFKDDTTKIRHVMATYLSRWSKAT